MIMSRTAILVTFLAAIGIITWHEIKTLNRAPHPDVYIHAAVVWAMLGILADVGVPDLAAIFGVGLVISMLYRFYTDGEPRLPLQGDRNVEGNIKPA